MAKQFVSYFVSWRDARKKPWGLWADEAAYHRAAAEALESKLNTLGQEGWIIDCITPSGGVYPKDTAGFTIVAFK